MSIAQFAMDDLVECCLNYQLDEVTPLMRRWLM